MTDLFQELREIIQAGGNLLPDSIHFSDHFSEACQQRLVEALRAVGSPYEPGRGDIASLVRHILRREDELQGGMSQTLKVPRNSFWPDRDTWQRSGTDVLREEADCYLISTRAWKPDWLPNSASHPPDVPAFKEEVRRSYESVSGDPFLSWVQLDKYRSTGQREAIRAVLTAPEKATLVINLPTGSGKSLCVQLPALLRSHNSGVSVVVVPTTALALDQERALKHFINHPTAYYSDLSSQAEERRKEIRDRIRQGTQRIIFTSPESLMDSLAPALYEAAKLGMLRYLAIDEAHIVEQWGDEFRPAFQELPGLRRDLLRLGSFITLLLTATLTESCVDTLETLFGKPGHFQVISAVQLRPEPAYWFAWCQSEEVRKQRLIEAVYHLPRPLIIYATKVADVQQWAWELASAGFKRYAIMTGQSSPEERAQLLKNWRERRVDIVVATSAFGLGVDQSDVRAVIHACIPETIDRFYQEVGRGGRDGKAAISLTLHVRPDLDIAKNLNEISYITIDRGRERWQSMFDRKETLPDGRFRVPVNIPPTLRENDIDMNSEQNRAWNIRTLTLMSRAGLIELDSELPPEKAKFESEDAYKKALQSYRNARILRIRDEYHLELDTWRSQVEPIRQQRQNWSYRNLELMREALRGNRCLSEIFAEAYTIPAREAPERRKAIRVSRACGGCPYCRKNGIEPFSGIMPALMPIWKDPQFSIGAELQRLLAGDRLLLIFYDLVEPRKWDRQRNKVFKWLIEQGIRNVVAPQELSESFSKEADRISNAFLFLFNKYEPIQMPHIPTLIFRDRGERLPSTYLSQTSTSKAPRIILLPVDTPDPDKDYRRLIDIFPGRYFSFDHFCTEINL